MKLQTIHLEKVYPGTVALNQVSIDFESGQIHALIGKNGAGKSTLVKILSGAIQPTNGKILLDGQEIKLHSPADAFQKGIATVYQDMSLIPELSIGENILFGRTPKKKILGGVLIDWPEVYRQANLILDNLLVRLDSKKKVSQLGIAEQQIVEIAKAMSFNPSVLLLDEPTSSLAHHEVENLFKLLKKLVQKGVAIIYISHRLQELNQIADQVSVLRDGSLIGTIPIQQAKPGTIARMMFGEILPQKRSLDLHHGDELILEVKDLSSRNQLKDISFKLYKGEILGIAGMLGSGRTELLRAIMGVDSFDSGEIQIGHQVLRTVDPIRMKKYGFGFTPENRKEQGLVQILSTEDNLLLASLNRISFYGLLSRKRVSAIAEKTVKDLRINVPDIQKSVSELSGGNQQKVVVGNWLNNQPRIMLFDEPTRGIDVQAKQQIFEIIWDLSRQGVSSIFVSSELEELLEVCHRILIIQKGRVIDELSPENMTLERLFAMCMES